MDSREEFNGQSFRQLILVVFFKRENKEFKKLIMRESRCIEVRRDRRDERGQYQ